LTGYALTVPNTGMGKWEVGRKAEEVDSEAEFERIGDNNGSL
jgi:hypothetical protein